MRKPGTAFRALALTCLAIGAALMFASSLTSRAQDETQPFSAKRGLIIEIDGAIGPATTRLIENGLAEAENRGATLAVLRIDTPGGLVTSTRDIIRAIIGAPVPVVGYVAPSGGRAASAGTYIMYATHIAAMAPGTNIGAATPVQMGGAPGLPGSEPQNEDSGDKDGSGDEEGGDGEDQTESPSQPDDPGKAKAVNDAVAFIRSLAELRGRNAAWAEKAVREAASISASEAREKGVIEIVATSMTDLMQQVDGRTVEIGGLERRLDTQGIQLETFEPSTLTKILGILANPNVAFIFMLVGIYGLIFEFANPGTIGPGVIGVICLVIGLYSLNQLPLDYAGLTLVLLGLAFMVAEAFTPSFGILGIGGLAAFIIGSLFLIDTDVPEYQLSTSVIVGTALASGLLLVVVLGYAWRSQTRAVTAGPNPYVGETVKVLEWSKGEGYVRAQGDRWHARGDIDVQPGDKVEVKQIDGLTLVVGPSQTARNSG
ncbi:NfeD family protein [Dichotomicrobium thermohalophilum]|uniref:Membrane-bound serine protease (ClpP class) n=1 Tax=Dichotomicrobium thermohalophilum TaxID=933063 RepID=A0A397Q398_9HYPH|nr:nodulation protein NfeD [Dichotomicrobium thermohalophilum]RIA55602.1 membrane-bound serine protease (ClpP class) [Dichotomicrobium thermohalophilum]